MRRGRSSARSRSGSLSSTVSKTIRRTCWCAARTSVSISRNGTAKIATLRDGMPRYLVANWKLNLPPEGIEAYLATISGVDPRDVEITIAPPFPFLRHVVQCGQGVGVAGQNCSEHPSGAFTGEVSPVMLRECGVDAVILGHSERRSEERV